MASVAIDSIIRHSHLERFLQTEHQQGLGGNAHFLTSGQDLRVGSCPRSRRCADCGAFSSAGNRANNRIQQRAAADLLGGWLVLTDAVPLFVTHGSIIRCSTCRFSPDPRGLLDTRFLIPPDHSHVSSVLLTIPVKIAHPGC